MHRLSYRFVLLLTIGLFLPGTSTCTTTVLPSQDQALTPNTITEQLERDPDVPELPFPDNPDPNECGIPISWGIDEPAWVSGYYQEELIQPLVYLYDSHLRLSIAGIVPGGTKVKIILYQQNPTLDYYLVKTIDMDPPQEGWIPAPFLSFVPTNQEIP